MKKSNNVKSSKEFNENLNISDVMKRSLIEEFKNIRNLVCGNRYVHGLTKDERKYNQKRFLEIKRILLSEYK